VLLDELDGLAGSVFEYVQTDFVEWNKSRLLCRVVNGSQARRGFGDFLALGRDGLWCVEHGWFLLQQN
jgi:hypothetical protein